MVVSYKKTWKLLIDKNLKKKDLIYMSGISNYTLNKLNARRSVTTDTLVKICEALHCGIEDIMDVVRNSVAVVCADLTSTSVCNKKFNYIESDCERKIKGIQGGKHGSRV